MLVWLKNFFYKLVLKERSSHKLALSSAWGIYVAFCPFIVLHTVMLFAFSWLFSLNFGVSFAVSYLINNPWTMVPVYASGYFFGELVLRLLRIDMLGTNPAWMHVINGPIERYLGISGVSLWAFVLGGNLLGVLISGTLYPVLERFFARLVREKYENHSAK